MKKQSVIWLLLGVALSIFAILAFIPGVSVPDPAVSVSPKVTDDTSEAADIAVPPSLDSAGLADGANLSASPNRVSGAVPRGILLPPDDPESTLSELVGSAAAGSYLAAEQLFLHVQSCGEARSVPRTPNELDERIAHVENFRTNAVGAVIEDRDAEIARLRQQYALCSTLRNYGFTDERQWLDRAAELGSPWAQAGYYFALQPMIESLSPAESDHLSALAKHYMERARDAGYADAFLGIGASMAGLVSGPYDRDNVNALAHFYAAQAVRAALIQRRGSDGTYADNPSLMAFNQARLASIDRHLRLLKLTVAAYDLPTAESRASELLQRCCQE